MRRALIGSTGFVGGNLLRAADFKARFNSANAEQMRGEHFDLLICAGLPAAKWIADRDPETDRANMESLVANISAVSARQAVVVSTVDVYGTPIGVDEGTRPEPTGPYGAHRFQFERAVRGLFESVLVVRLPALYGPGLRKNALFDLLNDHRLEAIRPDARFQWYDVRRLWDDIRLCLDARLELANLATEPIRTAELLRRDFPDFVPAPHEGEPPRYDMRTVHAEVLGGSGDYLESAVQALDGISAFVRQVREGVVSCG